MNHKMLFINISDEKKQRALGAALARACYLKSCVIYLQGEIGAGKTTLARGFLQALGYEGKIKSPTYSLMEVYSLNLLQIFHIDLYRINFPEEVFVLGLKENLSQNTGENSIYLIEWPEKALKNLPLPDITCYIEPLENKPQHRRCCLSAQTLQGKEILDRMPMKMMQNIDVQK